MLRVITKPCDSPTISEISLQVDEATPDLLVDDLINWLRSYLSEGALITDGETLQYGFTPLLCRVEGRTLRLAAPDFRSMPIHWIDDLSAVFHLLASHKMVPESIGLTPDIPSLQQSVIVGERFDQFPLFANRTECSEDNPADSGWFIGSQSEEVDNNDPDQLRVVSLYEAICCVPQLVHFLSLPAGCAVMCSGEAPVILKDWEEVTVPENSFLGALLKVA